MKVHSVLFAAVICAGTPALASAQLLTGRVLEAGTERPIASAIVHLLVDGQPLLSAESDSAGLFQLTPPRPGSYRLRVERFGYTAANTDEVTIGPGETVGIAIRMSVSAVPLAPLMVVERRSSVRPETEFERRVQLGRQTGNGVFITRAEMDSTTAMSTTALLARQPLVSQNRDGKLVTLSRGGCTPMLLINGAQFQLGTGEELDDLIQIENLEGVEIYRNRLEMPFAFGGIRECGAIVFWTRPGNPNTRGGLWRYFVAGGAVAGLAGLFLLVIR